VTDDEIIAIRKRTVPASFEGLWPDTIAFARALLSADASATPLLDPECICRGNWRAIVKEYAGKIGKQYRRRGEVWTFFGLVHTNDDYYYGLSDASHRVLLSSCVGSLEDFYELAVADASATPELEPLPPGFKSVKEYIAEVRRDPAMAKAMDDATPEMLRSIQKELLRQLREKDAVHSSATPVAWMYENEYGAKLIELQRWGYGGKLKSWTETPLYSCPRIPQQDEPSTPVARQEEPEKVNYVAGGRTHPATAQSDKPLGPDAVTKLGMDQYALGCKLPSIFWSMYQYGLADAAPAAVAREPQTELAEAIAWAKAERHSWLPHGETNGHKHLGTLIAAALNASQPADKRDAERYRALANKVAKDLAVVAFMDFRDKAEVDTYIDESLAAALSARQRDTEEK
jgi:hypothetical protein